MIPGLNFLTNLITFGTLFVVGCAFAIPFVIIVTRFVRRSRELLEDLRN